MGKVIKNSSGQVVLSGDKALEVTAAIDSNIVAGNIKKDVEILGVTGTYEGNTPTLTALSVTPTTSSQHIAPQGDGFSEVNVSAVTSGIDANIVAGNIKKDVEILGVTGTYEGSNNVVVSANTPKATTIPSGGMLPNVYYALGRISSNTTFTRNTTGLDSSIVNVWSFGFEVSGTPTITWPSSIVWAGGTAPTISDGNHYEISILDDWAMFAEFEDPTSGYNPPIEDPD